MSFSIDDLYNMITEENPQLQIQILEDGNMEVIAPTTFTDNVEMMEQLQIHIMKITSMAASMGMFFPSEITTMLQNYTENGANENGE